MTIGQRIKKLRERNGLTQQQFAEILGVTDGAVSSWEKDAYNPRMGVFQKIQDHFGVSKSYLIDGENELSVSQTTDGVLPYPDLIPVQKKRIPLFGGIAAGDPIPANQEYDTYVEADSDVHCDYALRVDGDSMDPTVRLGDLVFIRRQDDVDDGDIAAVLIDDSATLKRVYHVKNGLTLTSDNAKYPPRAVTYPEHDTIRILGKAVAFKRLL